MLIEDDIVINSIDQYVPLNVRHGAHISLLFQIIELCYSIWMWIQRVYKISRISIQCVTSVSKWIVFGVCLQIQNWTRTHTQSMGYKIKRLKAKNNGKFVLLTVKLALKLDVCVCDCILFLFIVNVDGCWTFKNVLFSNGKIKEKQIQSQ